MEKHKLNIQKIRKFSKKLGVLIISFIISYLLSLFSFFIYTRLSQVLMPENKTMIGFAIIGLTAGAISIVVSLISSRLVLTIVISFIIYCLIDSVSLYSKAGIAVIQYFLGLNLTLLAIFLPWYFLKKKLGITERLNLLKPFSKEHTYKEHLLARKLIENPDKLTLDTVKEALGLLDGINPKIDEFLKKVDYAARAINFIKGEELISFAVANIQVKTKKDKEKKEKVLLFIDLVNDLRKDVNTALIRFESVNAQGGHPLHQTDHSKFADLMTAIHPTSAVITAGIATIAAGSIVMASTPGITPRTNIRPTTIPTFIKPTAIPMSKPFTTMQPSPALIFTDTGKTIFISALQEGTAFTAESFGTYRFTIISGAYIADPAKGWESNIIIYKNRPIDWNEPSHGWGTTPQNWDYSVGNPNFLPSFIEAEENGKGDFIDISMQQGEYVIFLVFDSKGDFIDNSGGITLSVQKAI